MIVSVTVAVPLIIDTVAHVDAILALSGMAELWFVTSIGMHTLIVSIEAIYSCVYLSEADDDICTWDTISGHVTV